MPVNELYLGSVQDQDYISAYLSAIRRLDPIEIATVDAPSRLGDATVASGIDQGLFQQIVSESVAWCRTQYGVSMDPVPPSRYLTIETSDASDIGGFHGHASVGYQYWYHAAFVPMLSNSMSKTIRTIELARSVVHDALHHSTFRSFRRAIRKPAASPALGKHRVPEIYREQYGFNFRNQDGVSYSSALRARAPASVNLNILMDGVVVLTTANALRNVSAGLLIGGRGLEAEVIREIACEPFDNQRLPRAAEFRDAVTTPTQQFLAHWASQDLFVLMLQAMVSGDRTPLKEFFARRLGIDDAWSQLFRQPAFSLPLNPEA